MEKNIRIANDNANLMRFFIHIRQNISKYGKKLIKSKLLADSDQLMNGLDTLSSGLLSYTIIPPN